jgi:hypothetical protein
MFERVGPDFFVAYLTHHLFGFFCVVPEVGVLGEFFVFFYLK